MTSQDSTQLSGVQKVLAFLATGISILAALSFIIVVIGILNGIDRDELATGFWSALMLCTWLGFTAAVALIIAYVVVSMRRNAKAHRTMELS